MYIKILILTMVSLFSFPSFGTCPDIVGGPYYKYIDPEVGTQLDAGQVFVVKTEGVTITDSFPSFCSDINDKLAESKTLDSNQVFMIIGEFIVSIDYDDSFRDGYFKVALIKDGVIDMLNTRWIHLEDFLELEKNSGIEKITGRMIFQATGE